MMIIHPWRAVIVAPRAEIIVASALDEVEFTSCCPRYNLVLIRRGHRRSVIVPFVSSYVFARFGYDAETWHLVKSINGVSRILVGQVTEEEIRLLRYQVGDDTGILSHEVRDVLRGFALGDKVKLTEGVFKNFEGVIEYIDDDIGVVGIKTALLGREITVNQPLAWCEPSSEAGRTFQHKRRRREHRPSRRLAKSVEMALS